MSEARHEGIQPFHIWTARAIERKEFSLSLPGWPRLIMHVICLSISGQQELERKELSISVLG
jgi:hypothetical protein